jgi:hypothetical protein
MAEPAEAAVFNNSDVLVRRADYGTVEYIFAHPHQEEVWIVFTDLVGEFPGREEAAGAVVDVLVAMLMTLTFDR